jgi:hypothetical protein
LIGGKQTEIDQLSMSSSAAPVWTREVGSDGGAPRQVRLGNGVVELRLFDEATGMLRHISAGIGTFAVGPSGYREPAKLAQSVDYSYDANGRLKTREDSWGREKIGVFGAKQQFAIQISKATLLEQGLRITSEIAARSIFSIRGSTVVEGAFTLIGRF